MFARAAFLLLLLFAWAGPARAQSFPALSGRVVDAANIIPADREAALAAKLAAFEAETGRQMVVATVPDLQGYPIEDYGYRLGRHWALGSKDNNDGAMLLVAPNDRKVRIEVGYGLEPWLTDALSSVIINSQIIPHFKSGDFASGIEAGADAMIAQLKLTPEEAAARIQEAQADSGSGSGALIFWLFVLFFFVLPVILPLIFGKRGKSRRMGSGPVIIWGGGSDWGGSSSSSSSWGGGGGFSGGGGSFGGGGASGSW